MFNKKKKRIEELEVELMASRRQANTYFNWFADRDRRKNELVDDVKDLETELDLLNEKYKALEEKLKNVELELEQTKKSCDHWYNQFEHVSGECNAYAAIANKFMAVHEDGDVDDTCIIHNGKVYTIIGVKHIVDNLGDTLDVRAELIDPEKAEKKIGFKPEEKGPVIKEDEE